MRPDFRIVHGPLSLTMPNDGDGKPLVNGVHEDDQDRLNPDGSVGPAAVGAEGGSGIVFGYSVGDIDNVRLMEAGVRRRAQPYDDEHLVREFRYSHAAWEMTHETQYARRIVQIADAAHARWSETGPTYDGAEWTPQNVAQYLHMANHQGVPLNGRALGWVAWNEAMAMKVTRGRNPAFANAILDMCDKAACLGTGQVCAGANTGGGALNSDRVVYVFHQSILACGVLALCYRLGKPAPWWVVNWALTVGDMPVMAYYGAPSMPAFWYTQGDQLVQARGVGQHGDPAFGWHSSLCVCLWKVSGNPIWLERAAKWGPTTVTDEQSRKFSMLLRGTK